MQHLILGTPPLFLGLLSSWPAHWHSHHPASVSLGLLLCCFHSSLRPQESVARPRPQGLVSAPWGHPEPEIFSSARRQVTGPYCSWAYRPLSFLRSSGIIFRLKEIHHSVFPSEFGTKVINGRFTDWIQPVRWTWPTGTLSFKTLKLVCQV